MSYLTTAAMARFDGLPEGLKGQFYQSPIVHMWVSAYIHGKIEREPMLAELASQLAMRNAETENNLLRFMLWFGGPPPPAFEAPKQEGQP